MRNLTSPCCHAEVDPVLTEGVKLYSKTPVIRVNIGSRCIQCEEECQPYLWKK